MWRKRSTDVHVVYISLAYGPICSLRPCRPMVLSLQMIMSSILFLWGPGSQNSQCTILDLLFLLSPSNSLQVIFFTSFNERCKCLPKHPLGLKIFKTCSAFWSKSFFRTNSSHSNKLTFSNIPYYMRDLWSNISGHQFSCWSDRSESYCWQH